MTLAINGFYCLANVRAIARKARTLGTLIREFYA
jgi:hypothetical protein